MSPILHEEVSRSVIGAAMEVLNTLKPGLDEKVYEKAMVVELKHRGHVVEQQRRFPVQYREQLVGTFVPDLLVDDCVIVDTKVVSTFNEAHFAQMAGYLAITRFRLAILLNFKFPKLEWKRIVA